MSKFFKNQGSITQKTLLQISLSVTLIITGSTALNYWQLLSSLKSQKQEQLKEYVIERVAREQEIFDLAADNHAILKEAILNSEQSPNSQQIQQNFDRLFVRYTDGVIRNRPELFNGTEESGVYIGKSASLTPTLRRQIPEWKTLSETYGRAWHNRFQSTFLMTPDNITIVYWPEVPNYVYEADANFYMPEQEEYQVAVVQNNPLRTTAWTAPYREDVSQLWLVTAVTPVDINGQQIISIGHDVILNDLVDRTVNSTVEGGYNLIFRGDGHLIVHPELMNQLQDRNQPFLIQESGNQNLIHIFELVTQADTNKIVIENTQDNQYLAVQKINGPELYFVTVFPKNILAQRAVGFALSNVEMGLALLVTIVGFIIIILNTQVTKPLKRLIDATQKIAQGDYHISIPEYSQDELGMLAHSFNLMATELLHRQKAIETALQKEKNLADKVTNTLERQASSVQQVTTTMDELNASAQVSANQASEAAISAQEILDLLEGKHERLSTDGYSNLKDKIEKLAKEISHLSEQIGKIGMISGVVSDLANQTNMLALNAAVEAVRAGENGQGFSVIATEIRKLADQSRASAEAINNLAINIQKAMNSTVDITESSKNSFNTMIDSVNHIVINSEQLSLNANQQAMAIEQVLNAMNELNQSTTPYSTLRGNEV
ncbi:methyl-accepting chemotaxis protein [Roseofilum sp. BLCC_M154]|uniref:Methyl-accepting chemotaxis protein n=1 Tax=Roseofilum acuticapitatum BLCC-M154 TaxID=3022444 RepID=A0ABT7AVN2_9CYAN|nr:methyl-accepting chemotaxis protein [Roseofilum acuticapitatum]MDJ1170951.1 methyl-accepting chemotaxis protein [Roseofilum acuticapitatum BLCC-M154]